MHNLCTDNKLIRLMLVVGHSSADDQHVCVWCVGLVRETWMVVFPLGEAICPAIGHTHTQAGLYGAAGGYRGLERA